MDNQHDSTKTNADRNLKIPKLIGVGNHSDQRSLDHLTAIRHRKHLNKAEIRLWDVENLLDILFTYLDAQDSDECCRAKVLVTQVETAVEKAMKRINRHGTDHDNLFIAYCEQKRNGADTSSVLSPQAALPTDEKLEDVLFGTQEEMEASLTEALDSFPYDSASEESLVDLEKARKLMGQAWQLVSKANGREANAEQ